MTIVTCSTCGPVGVDPGATEVHVNHRTGFALYAYLCPGCGEYRVGGCRETSQELRAGGARVQELRCMGDAAFTLDDVVALRAWIDTEPDWAAADSTRTRGENH